MGTGLYLVWPAFYTDVTDSYRLGRGGRLRVDLGGLYFNALVAVAMFGVWARDRVGRAPADPGHPAAADGAPAGADGALRRLPRPRRPHRGPRPLPRGSGPTLRSLLPGPRAPTARAAALKPWARVVVTAWVLVIVPLLLFTLVLMVLALPRVLGHRVGQRGQPGARPHRRLGRRRRRRRGGQGAGDRRRRPCRVLGSLLVLVRLVRSTHDLGVARTKGRPGRRALAVARGRRPGRRAWPGPGGPTPTATGRSRPSSAARSSTGCPGSVVGGIRPPAGRPDRQGAAHRVGLRRRTPPTRDHPELALVLVPESAARRPARRQRAPAWVFPFNRPRRAGGGGQPGPRGEHHRRVDDLRRRLRARLGRRHQRHQQQRGLRLRQLHGAARPWPWPSRSSSSPVTRMSPYPRTSPARSTTPASSASPTPWRQQLVLTVPATSTPTSTGVWTRCGSRSTPLPPPSGPAAGPDPQPAARLPGPDQGRWSSKWAHRHPPPAAPPRPPARGRRPAQGRRPARGRRPRRPVLNLLHRPRAACRRARRRAGPRRPSMTRSPAAHDGVQKLHRAELSPVGVEASAPEPSGSCRAPRLNRSRGMRRTTAETPGGSAA